MKKILIVLALLFVTGCSKNIESSGVTSSESVKPGFNVGEVTNDRFVEYDKEYVTSDKVDSEFDKEEQKISYTVDLMIETEDFDKSISDLKSLIEKHSGIVKSSNIYEDSYRNNREVANYRVDIPTKIFETFSEDSKIIGNITSQSVSETNLTSSYIDVTSRLNSLNAQETRLLELLESANNLTDLLAIENQLSNVRYQIESYTRQLNSIEDKVEYTSFSIYIEEVEDIDESVLSKIGDLFVQSFESFVSFLSILIIGLPYIVIACVVWYFIRRNIRNKQNKDIDKK